MKKSTFILAGAALALVMGTVGRANADSPAEAGTLMRSAMQRAGKEHKAILVMFHASWCGWCKRLDAVLDRPEFKKLIDQNYVSVTLDVMESKDKTQLENPGGADLMKELGGAESGLPFYAFLDAKGKKLADSNAMPGHKNIGYPGEPGEITAFIELIKKTAPRWSAPDREKLRAYLVEHAPAAAGH